MNPPTTSGFFEFTLGNVITWVGMMAGFVAMWQKNKDTVENLARRLDHIEKTVEDINNKGTPANNTVAMVLESRLQSQSARIMAIEEAVKEFSGIRVNVEWIKDWIQRKQMKESL